MQGLTNEEISLIDYMERKCLELSLLPEDGLEQAVWESCSPVYNFPSVKGITYNFTNQTIIIRRGIKPKMTFSFAKQNHFDDQLHNLFTTRHREIVELYRNP